MKKEEVEVERERERVSPGGEVESSGGRQVTCSQGSHLRACALKVLAGLRKERGTMVSER